jgi:tripartite-type tricarboxylate transporter receptor subunit TctC
LNRLSTVLNAFVLIACFMTAAQVPAQTQPAKIVTGFAAGGSVDAVARLVAEQLQRPLARVVIVENKTGAAGRLAVEQVKAAPPNGDTLLLVPHGPMTLFPHVFKSLRFDPAKDFTPLTRVVNGDYALTVGPQIPAKDIPGLREWLKKAGDKANFASPGAGTIPHFLGVSLARQWGTPITHVPYRGSAPALTDVAGGSIPMAVTPVSEALALHKAGKVRILATMGQVRSPFLQGVPTLKESGVDIDVPLWYAIYGPAGMAPEVIENLRAAITTGLNAPGLKERLESLGLVPAPSTADELVQLQARESKLWGPLVKASGFTPED